MESFDLLIGGDMGLYALSLLRTEDAEKVRRVVTVDQEVAAKATKMGFPVASGDLNKMYASASLDRATWALSVHYPVILKSETLARYRKVYNLHPGLLPYGRGMYPIAWAIGNLEPAGVTLHEMVAKLDAGPIVAQSQVYVLGCDTAETLHERVREAERILLSEFLYPVLRLGKGLPDGHESKKLGHSYHSKAEFEAMRISLATSLNQAYDIRVEDLFRLARMFTFPPYPPLEVNIGGKIFELRLTEKK